MSDVLFSVRELTYNYDAGDDAALGRVSSIEDEDETVVPFRQACVKRFERRGIVGCQHIDLWRTAHGYQKGTRPRCPAESGSAAIRGVAADSEDPFAHPRTAVGCGREGGRRPEAALGADDYETIKAVIGAYVYLFQVLGDKNTTIRRLRQMLFGTKTEKIEAVIGGLRDADPAAAPPEAEAAPESSAGTEAEASAKGDGEAQEPHPEDDSPASAEGRGRGRNGADDFTGAEQIEVRHESLQPGDPYPKCGEGTLYDTGRPGTLVRLVGQPPVAARVYYLQKLRCNPCGALFGAEPGRSTNSGPSSDTRDET